MAETDSKSAYIRISKEVELISNLVRRARGTWGHDRQEIDFALTNLAGLVGGLADEQPQPEGLAGRLAAAEEAIAKLRDDVDGLQSLAH